MKRKYNWIGYKKKDLFIFDIYILSGKAKLF